MTEAPRCRFSSVMRRFVRLAVLCLLAVTLAVASPAFAWASAGAAPEAAGAVAEAPACPQCEHAGSASESCIVVAACATGIVSAPEWTRVAPALLALTRPPDAARTLTGRTPKAETPPPER